MLILYLHHSPGPSLNIINLMMVMQLCRYNKYYISISINLSFKTIQKLSNSITEFFFIT